MPADILRDREDAPASTFADVTQAAPPDLSARLAANDQAMAVAREKQARAREDETAAMQTTAAALRPQVQALDQAQAQRDAIAAQRPVPQALPAPPKATIQPFLAPIDGEAPDVTIGKVLQGVELLAAGFTGLKRGNASTALASMAGALKGWNEGKKDLFDREFAKWRGATDALIEENREAQRSYETIMRDTDISIAQKMELLKLRATELGHEQAVATFGRQNADEDVKFLMDYGRHLDSLQKSRDTLNQSFNTQQQYIQQRELDRQAAERRHQETLEDRKQGRAEQALNRLDQIEAKKGEKNTEPAHGEFYDWKSGKVRQITKGEWQENSERAQRGETPLFTHMTNQQVATIERLAVAPTIYNRLDELIDKISAAAPGENITQGLLNRLKKKAGISPDIAEFTAIQTDAAVELAAALSGGQPRISILAMIRDEAQPGLSMTADTAHRMVQAGRVTIKNRLQTTTGDPDAYDKLSRGLKPYSGQKDQPKTMLIQRTLPDGRVIQAEGPEGAVPAGWARIERGR